MFNCSPLAAKPQFSLKKYLLIPQFFLFFNMKEICKSGLEREEKKRRKKRKKSISFFSFLPFDFDFSSPLLHYE